MGATLITQAIPACSDAELHARYRDLQEHDGYMKGHDAYGGGFFNVNGLTIRRTLYATSQEAIDAHSDDLPKRGPALAVRVGQGDAPPFSQTRRARDLAAKRDMLQREFDHFDRNLIRKAQQGTSASKTCRTCGSRITLSYLHDDPRCPVCHQHTLFGGVTTDKQRDRLSQRLQKAARAYTEAEQAYSAGRQAPRWAWLVMGVAPE